jgi:hypothetical protein
MTEHGNTTEPMAKGASGWSLMQDEDFPIGRDAQHHRARIIHRYIHMERPAILICYTNES